ncbi:MAG: biotin/lipoyl-containing protein [Bradymonadia bacterium]
MSRYVVKMPGGQPIPVRLTAGPRGWSAEVEDGAHWLKLVHFDGQDAVCVEIDGDRYELSLSRDFGDVEIAPATLPPTTHKPRPKAIAAPGDFTSTITGAVLEICVGPGDHVQPGDPLVVIEAMKMENTLCAPRAGTIVAISARQGDTVRKGETLLVLGPPPLDPPTMH